MQLDVGKGTKRPPPRRWGLLGRPLLVLVALVAVGVLAAGCSGAGSGGMGGSGSGGTAPASGGVSGVAMVSAASTGLGMILVDGSGRTLYVFAKDQPDQSACAGACVAAWPVDRSSGAPTAGSGVTGSMLGTIRRGDGSSQVTYHQHPLYYFHGDSGAGQQHGQGVDAFGAKWFVVNPAGGAVTATALLVAASALGAVLLYRYVDVGSLGPLPDMYESTWQMPGELLSAYAEGAAVVLAGLGLMAAVLARLSAPAHRELGYGRRPGPAGRNRVPLR